MRRQALHAPPKLSARPTGEEVRDRRPNDSSSTYHHPGQMQGQKGAIDVSMECGLGAMEWEALTHHL